MHSFGVWNCYLLSYLIVSYTNFNMLFIYPSSCKLISNENAYILGEGWNFYDMFSKRWKRMCNQIIFSIINKEPSQFDILRQWMISAFVGLISLFIALSFRSLWYVFALMRQRTWYQDSNYSLNNTIVSPQKHFLSIIGKIPSPNFGIHGSTKLIKYSFSSYIRYFR